MDQNDLRLKELERRIQSLYGTIKAQNDSLHQIVDCFRGVQNALNGLDYRIKLLESQSQENHTP